MYKLLILTWNGRDRQTAEVVAFDTFEQAEAAVRSMKAEAEFLPFRIGAVRLYSA